MEHSFTENIKEILNTNFGNNAVDIFEKSELIQYINIKTKSANKGSKSRPSFGTLFAIYTIIDDYINNGFLEKDNYAEYEGANFSSILKRAKSLHFGDKMQNHYFNNRTNSEFKKYFPLSQFSPIHHEQSKKKYWINENLLKIKVNKTNFNIAKSIIEIIDNYISTKKDSFERFVESCQSLQKIEKTTPKEVEDFIIGLLAPNVDARLFEIVSFSILKYYYHDQSIFWGYETEKLKEEKLSLYKTGRTNANDGGIDFVMKPLGKFFQVTETLDFKKYFLDIDKIQKYPITFVIKSNEDKSTIKSKIQQNANKIYSVNAIVNRYMECIEEIINIPLLNDCFNVAVKQGYLNEILDEIILQSKVEFNYSEN